MCIWYHLMPYAVKKLRIHLLRKTLLVNLARLNVDLKNGIVLLHSKTDMVMKFEL